MTKTVSKIQAWGNSQGLRLSKELLRSAEIAVGDQVNIKADKGTIIIEKTKKYVLSEMVAQLPSTYQAQEESFGDPVGKEDW